MSGDAWWRQKQRGMYEYGISPFYQKAFGPDYARMWKAFFGGSFRLLKEAAIPLAAAAGIILWSNSYHRRLNRKDPYDYIDEE